MFQEGLRQVLLLLARVHEESVAAVILPERTADEVTFVRAISESNESEGSTATTFARRRNGRRRYHDFVTVAIRQCGIIID